ncbi:MAG: NUDIX hydrolase [Dictyoglomus sp.]|nr:NUDIX hydrolase [Dictyoglomus sp.]MCX7941785.1 NUDIX hydrolase [Dictyoglomaceae bacterium]MDW8188113.1 NUDIX hydrolase [Dictyoglomus sp.]
MIEKILREKLVYKGKIVNIKEVEVELPNGKIGKREIVEHPGAVAILPIDQEGGIFFVKQYRMCTGEILLEIPAGKLNYGEDPYQCAIRELEEEIGYKAKDLKLIHAFFTSPGISNEILYLFEAKDLEKTQINPDEDEFLEIIIIKRENLKKLIKENKIKDAKTLIALYYYLTKEDF